MKWFPAQKVLLRLDPEAAHAVVRRLLMLYQSVFPWRREIGKRELIEIESLPGLKFTSRVGMAAGFDKQAEFYAALARLGFGFVEVGTVVPLPQEGNPKPRIFRLPGNHLTNHLGFNSVGLAVFQRNLLRHRKQMEGFPIFANIGKNRATPESHAIEDYRLSFEALQAFVDGFVVNLSSPNTPGLTELQNLSFLESLKKIAPKKLPVLLKFSPDLEDGELRKLFEFIRDERAFRGVVLGNTSRARAEAHGFKQGGLSGPELFPRTLQMVKLARSILPQEKTVIGVGGVRSRTDVKALLEAGADLIEIYTGFIYGGPAILSTLVF